MVKDTPSSWPPPVPRSLRPWRTANLWWWMFALVALFWTRDLWVSSSQVQPIPCSEFAQQLKDGRLESTSIGSQFIEGKLKSAAPGGRTRIVTTRVAPDLARGLSAHDVRLEGVVENTLLRELLSWVVPALLLLAVWSFMATRRGAEAVAMSNFTAAVERIVAGLERHQGVLGANERRTVAVHEMGHALVAMALPGTDPVRKISIIPRGIGALGYTMQRPSEDRCLTSRSELRNRLDVLMGGRAAEALVMGEVSTGAADDLVKASDIAHDMVARYGMSSELGQVVYERQQARFLGLPEAMAQETLTEAELPPLAALARRGGVPA